MAHDFSIILPTLNEQGNIKKVINELAKTFKNNTYEIIIVDDHSEDRTVKIATQLKKKNLKIKIRILYGKRSLVNSLNKGIQIARYNKIIWLDVDMSHPPSELNKIIKSSVFNSDVIVFSRFLKKSQRYYMSANYKKTFMDNLSIFLNKICQNILFKDFTDYTSGFICINKSVFKNYKLHGHYGDYFINLITYCKLKKLNIIEIPFKELPRFSGYSKTSLGKISFTIKCFFYMRAVFINYIKKLLN
jgi:dolichol-phosphate mannosyltransferase